jgi:ubiquinone/menaquinone biosynthesis C-methylase UbiE
VASAPAYAIGQFRDAGDEVERLRQQAAVLGRVEDDTFRALGFPERGRGIDVGCGPGFIAQRFAATRPELSVIGLDLDRAALELARGRARLPVLAGSALALPVASGALDFAYARFVLRYLPEAGRALAELARVTRPGGGVFALDSDDGAIVVHPEPDGFAAVLRARHESLRRRGAEPAFARRLPALFERQGLRDVAGRTLTLSTLAVGGGSFARLALAPVAEAIDRDVMPEGEVRAAAAAIRAWADLPGAFGMTTVVLVTGRTPPATEA